MQNFVIGSGFSTAAVVHILDKWLQSGGIHANSRIDNRPVAQVLHQRLTRRFGAQRFRLFRGNLDVMELGEWRVLVHRDDIRSFLYGKEMVVKIGKAPDPSEEGVEVPVKRVSSTTKIDGVVEWEKTGPKSFQCTACGLVRKTEDGIVTHITRDH